jgi:hypothetical protein
LIYNLYDCVWTDTGVRSIVTWLTNADNWGVAQGKIFPRSYQGNAGAGEPNPGQPKGLAVVRVRLLASLVCRILLTSNNYSG